MLFVVYLCLYGLVGLYLVSRGAALFGLALPVMRREILGFRAPKTGFLRRGRQFRYFFLRTDNWTAAHPWGSGSFRRNVVVQRVSVTAPFQKKKDCKRTARYSGGVITIKHPPSEGSFPC